MEPIHPTDIPHTHTQHQSIFATAIDIVFHSTPIFGNIYPAAINIDLQKYIL
jgi:hypothetical protein